jgi:high affinity sulfate transporter 1
MKSARAGAAILPIAGWLRTYRLTNLRPDLVAGISLAATAIPESLAHAHLAGLRPGVGLAAGMAAAFTYAVLGRTPQLVMSTDAALAILISSNLGALSGGDPDRAAPFAAFAALMAGLAALMARVLRLGFLSNLMSRSVLVGFSCGAGIVIAIGQLPGLLGVERHGAGLLDQLHQVLLQLPQARWVDLAMGLTTLALLMLGERLLPRRPVTLLVMLVAVVCSRVLDLPHHGLKAAGGVLKVHPSLSLPAAAVAHWRDLLPLGLTLFLLSYLENMSAAHTLASRRREAVSPDHELLASGACNVAAGLFGGMAVGTSMSQSLSNLEMARTQLAGIVSGALILAVALFVHAPFAYLPEAVLAAIIMMHARRLVDVAALRNIFALSRREFAIAAVTMVTVLFFGLLRGVLVGVILTLFDMLERVNHPYTAVMGQLPGSDRYVDLVESPECRPVEDVLIVRMEASIFAANAESVRRVILEKLAAHAGPVKLLVLDLETCPLIDVSGGAMLEEMHDALAEHGTGMQIADANGRVRRFLETESPERFGQAAQEVSEAIRRWRQGGVGVGAGQPA